VQPVDRVVCCPIALRHVKIELARPEQFLTFHLVTGGGAADVQFFDVVGSRSKRSNRASDDEADARRQKSPARS
jgi:hypothetical protein